MSKKTEEKTEDNAIKCEVCGKALKPSGFEWAQVVILPLHCPTEGCLGSIEDYEFETEDDKMSCHCPLCKEAINFDLKRRRLGGEVTFGWRGNGRFCSQKCAAESIFE